MAYILCEKVRSLEPYEPISGTYNIRLDANESCYQLPESLKADIQKAIDDVDNRVSHEILEYMHGIRNVKMQDDILEKIVDFLANLIAGEKEDLADNIMFFPFLLRNNEKIVPEMNIDDYKNFSLQGVKRENVENIILSFRKKFSEFSNEVYEEAIGE